MALQSSINRPQMMSPTSAILRASAELFSGSFEERNSREVSISLAGAGGSKNRYHTPTRATTPARVPYADLPTWTPLAEPVEDEANGEGQGVRGKHKSRHTRMDQSQRAATSAYDTDVLSPRLPAIPPVKAKRKPLASGSLNSIPLVAALNGLGSSSLPHPLPTPSQNSTQKAAEHSSQVSESPPPRARMVFDGVELPTVASIRRAEGLQMRERGKERVPGQKRTREEMNYGEQLARVLHSAFQQNHRELEDTRERGSKDSDGKDTSEAESLPRPATRRPGRLHRRLPSESSSDAEPDAHKSSRAARVIDSEPPTETDAGPSIDIGTTFEPPTSTTASSTPSSVIDIDSEPNSPVQAGPLAHHLSPSTPQHSLANALSAVFAKNKLFANDVPAYMARPPTVSPSRLMAPRKSGRHIQTPDEPASASTILLRIPKAREVDEDEFDSLLETVEMPVREKGQLERDKWSIEDTPERVTMDTAVLLQGQDLSDDTKQPVEPATSDVKKVRFQQTPADMYVKRIERMFGPGKVDRGFGKKPRKPRAKPPTSGNRTPITISIGTSSATSRARSEESEARRNANRSVATDGGFGGERESKRRRIEEEDEEVALRPIDKDTALEWAFTLKRVTKGKTVIDSEAWKGLRNTMKDIDRIKGNVPLEILKSSRLWHTIVQLSELNDLPKLAIADGLREKAKSLKEFWMERFGAELA